MKDVNQIHHNGDEQKKPVSDKKTDMINLGELQTASNGDVDFYIDMLELFIEGTEKGIEEIQSGYATGDWERVANYAHKISSPCRHISAKQLYQYLKEIETQTRNKKTTSEVGELVQLATDETNRVLELVKNELARERANKIQKKDRFKA